MASTKTGFPEPTRAGAIKDTLRLPAYPHKSKDNISLLKDTTGIKSFSFPPVHLKVNSIHQLHLKTLPGGTDPNLTPQFPNFDEWITKIWPANPLIIRSSTVESDMEIIRPTSSPAFLFYLLAGIFLLLAVIRLLYYKYFHDLFRAFINPTLSNRQLKDQLSQTPLPSLLLNIFFAISTGVYFFLLLRYFKFIESYHPFLVVSALVILVGLVYLIKFLLLRICGWLFGNRELVDGYLFNLFLINKMTGIILLPFLVILAFCSPLLADWGFNISISLIALLIAYRYIRSYGLAKNYISLSKLHFFLYLCAFEIAPVLIIAKVVLIWLNGNV